MLLITLKLEMRKVKLRETDPLSKASELGPILKQWDLCSLLPHRTQTLSCVKRMCLC